MINRITISQNISYLTEIERLVQHTGQYHMLHNLCFFLTCKLSLVCCGIGYTFIMRSTVYDHWETTEIAKQDIDGQDMHHKLLQSATNYSVYFDATFKVVPRIYYQLFTLIVPYTDSAFPVMYALMSRNYASSLNGCLCEGQWICPHFTPLFAKADFEEASGERHLLYTKDNTKHF